MKATLTAFVSGIVFALGLGLPGMTRPVKVIGFLDFFGKWDASLAFVMIGAIAIYSIAYRLSNTMKSPLLAPVFSIPKRSDFDSKLILGAAIFGAGWGLSGFCPGPAITSLASGALPVFIFVLAMGLGMYLHSWLYEFRSTASGLIVQPVKSIQDA
jgi:uncharacterized protein